MFITCSLLWASANIVPKKKQAQFSLHALHVHSNGSFIPYESSEDNETWGGEDSLGAGKMLKEN